jgi:hypothetical protein
MTEPDHLTQKDHTTLAVMQAEMRHLSHRVSELQHSLELRDEDLKATIEKLVTRLEFHPVKAAVFGLVAAIVLAVIGAILALVIR